MSQQALDSAAALRESLLFSLNEIADAEGFELQGKSAPVAFRWLIGTLKEKYKAKVVVLIDEYDKPIIDFLAASKKADANGLRASFRQFLWHFKRSGRKSGIRLSDRRIQIHENVIVFTTQQFDGLDALEQICGDLRIHRSRV
jgi:hypothetical protein